jgi:uncharacterized protein YbbC (DUF1343 family)
MKVRNYRSRISLGHMKHRCRVRTNSYATRFALYAVLLILILSAGSSIAGQTRVRTVKGRSRVGRVQTGLDVLEAEKFAPLRGKHIGLITNHTGLDYQERTTINVLAHAPGVEVVALFSPEHGIAGHSDEKFSSSKDASTGLPIYSLYGDHLRPTAEMLEGIDALVFDVQDAGVRFYTYTSTMAYCMEEAAKRNIAFFVLDRPNPLNGDIIEGPMLDADKTSFVAYYPLPVRYGLTIGELAQFLNTENHINAQLHVISMKSWHRNYYFESTGLKWIPPSPNLRTLKGSMLYPGLEILQNAGVSVGRGTEAPFEEFGAPWIDGEEIATLLNTKGLPGVHFVNQPFIPVSGLYAGQHCRGVGVRVTDRAALRSIRVGLEIAAALRKKYPDHFDVTKILLLLGNDSTIQQLQAGTPPAEIIANWNKDLAAYDAVRRRYFLYK